MSTVTGKNRPIAVVLVATHWGVRHGGVNSFNYDFAAALAKCTRHTVACVVPSATLAEQEDASRQGVALFPASSTNEVFEEASLTVLARRPEFSSARLWIGHDLITGPAALLMCSRSEHGRTAVLMHQSYQAYATVKHLAAFASPKVQEQRQLFQKADLAFAVGPLLRKRLDDLAPNQQARMLIPGLAERAHNRAKSHIHATLVGRLSKDNLLLKGTALGAHALAHAVRRVRNARTPSPLSDAILTVIGVQEVDADAEDLKRAVEQTAERCLSVHQHPYLTRDEMFAAMSGSNLSLMLSWHEGFGLAGWEAIAAGIPLVLSKQSGLYEFLESVGGSATGCVRAVTVNGSFDSNTPFRQEDLAAASDAILDVSASLERAIQDADYLRRLLLEKGFTWIRMAREFLSDAGVPDVVRPAQSPQSGAETGAYIGFAEGLDHARREQRLHIARTFYHTGYYRRALAEVDSTLQLCERQKSAADECHLLRAEILLRLNRHSEAKLLALRLYKQNRTRGDWRAAIKAQGIVNTVQRALGQYSEAVRSARRNTDAAKEHSENQLGSTLRDLARSLALRGSGDGPGDAEGVEVAKESLELAGTALDRAKALLALGEALRHTGAYDESLSIYAESVRWSTTVGHYDCLLWASLGLSDVHYLRGDVAAAFVPLATVKAIVSDPDRQFPIENLHYGLSILALEFSESGRWSPQLARRSSALLGRYGAMGVKWPVSYFRGLKEAAAPWPKRF